MAPSLWDGNTMRQAWQLEEERWVCRSSYGYWFILPVSPEGYETETWTTIPALGADTYSPWMSSQYVEACQLIDQYVAGTVRPPDWWSNWTPDVGTTVWHYYKTSPGMWVRDYIGHTAGSTSQSDNDNVWATTQPWPPTRSELLAVGQKWDVKWGDIPGYDWWSGGNTVKAPEICRYHGEILERIPVKADPYGWAATNRGMQDHVEARMRWHRNYGKYARGMPLCSVAGIAVPIEIAQKREPGRDQDVYTIILSCPHCREK